MLVKKGFTLVELMIAILIATILSALSVPIFTSLIQSSKTTTETNNLVSYIMLARQEAVNRGLDVKICPKSFNQTKCSNNNNWSEGFIVFEDLNRDGKINDSGDIIQIGQINDGLHINSSKNYIEFEPSGFIKEEATIYIEVPGCVNKKNKKIEITRPNKIKTTSVSC